jgi:transposase InsO family protein
VIHVRDTSNPTRSFMGNSLWYWRYVTKSLGNVSMWFALVPSRFKLKILTSRLTFLEIHCLTMVDSCTSWSEATPLLNHSAKHAAKKFDKAWLCSKPCPLQVVHDNGTEFIGAEFQEMLSSYNIEPKCTTVKNPTANALVKRLHSTLEDQL